MVLVGLFPRVATRRVDDRPPCSCYDGGRRPRDLALATAWVLLRVRRRPYLFLSCGHWEHYHAPTDTPDRLNYKKMASIARFLEELTARASAARLEGPFEKHDTTATELHYVRKHLGPLAAALEIKLEGRRGIEALVDAMLASGL